MGRLPRCPDPSGTAGPEPISGLFLSAGGAVASPQVTSVEITPTGLGELEPGSAAEGARGGYHPRTSRSCAGSVRACTLTIPNEILLSLGVLEIMFGSCRDPLLVGILVSNIAVGGFGRDRRSVTDVLVEGCW